MLRVDRRALARRRVHNIQHRRPGRNVGAGLHMEHHDAGQGGNQVFDPGQGRGGGGGGRGTAAGNQALMPEERQQRRRVLGGHAVGHIGGTPQLNRAGEAGLRYGGAGVRAGEIEPRAARGLVERVVAAFVCQQHRVGAQEPGKCRGLRGAGGQGIEVHRRLTVAVQVEHDVGVERVMQQGVLQVLGWCQAGQSVVRGQQGGAVAGDGRGRVGSGRKG